MTSEGVKKPPLFMLDNLVVTSSGDIDVLKWRDFFLDKIELLIGDIPKRTVVILDGVHDNLSVEHGFFEEDVKMVEFLKTSPYCEKREYIDRLQIVFEVINLGDYMKSEKKIDIERLAPEITKRAPSILMLNFCVSDASELNDDLTLAGIYANLILQEEMLKITGGRCLTASKDQKNCIEEVARTKPRAVLIQGPSGSGKTIVGVQATKMTASRLVQEHIQTELSDSEGQGTEVIVCQGFLGRRSEGQHQLIKDLEISLAKVGTQAKKIEVKFATMKELQRDLNVESGANMKESLCKLVKHLSTITIRGRVVMFMDEVEISGGDWRAVDQLVRDHQNIFLILCLRPLSGGEAIQWPTGVRTVTCQLRTQYRYCPEIQRLLAGICNHLGEEQPESPNIDSQPDGGQVPVWFDCGDWDDFPKCLPVVKTMLAAEDGRKLSVTVVGGSIWPDVETWCRENASDWKLTTDDGMIGAEDDAVISVSGYSTAAYREQWSRARKALFILTGRFGDGERRNILRWAAGEELVQRIDM